MQNAIVYVMNIIYSIQCYNVLTENALNFIFIGEGMGNKKSFYNSSERKK